jgi:hypothetical protein
MPLFISSKIYSESGNSETHANGEKHKLLVLNTVMSFYIDKLI